MVEPFDQGFKIAGAGRFGPLAYPGQAGAIIVGGHDKLVQCVGLRWRQFTDQVRKSGTPGHFWFDAPGVLGPPILVLAGIGLLVARRRIVPAGIPKRALLALLERTSPGESAYLREIAEASGHTFEKFRHFMPFTMHRYEASADLFHMTRIGATLAEDCGPCALTSARGALSDGVSRALINQALAGRPPTGDLMTAFAFGRAVATQSSDAAALGDQIEAIYGRGVRVELSITAATVRAYPAMKRGLGLGQSCSLTAMMV